MSKLRDFIGKIPELCGAKQADVRGMRNLLIFDYEMKNNNGVLNRERFKDNPDERLDVLFDFIGDENKKNYCRALLNIKMYTSYGDEEKVLENTNNIESLEVVPEIDSVYSVEDASISAGTLRGWY